ncbi:MAG: cell division protein FtsL [Candidatus Wallbacteria bacterium]
METEEIITVNRKNISIKKVAESKHNIVFFYVLIAILLCTMILTYVWSFVKMVEVKVTYSKLTSELKNLIKERDDLLVERAKLSASNRIEEIAKEKLKMVLPTNVQYVSLISNNANTGSTSENILEKNTGKQ